jgi:glycosidase
MLEDVRKIINTRKNHPALRYGDFLTLIADESIYAYIRSDMNERILIALNKNENPRKLKLEVPQFYNIKTAVNLVGNEEVNIANNKLEIELDGIGYKILLLK